MNHTTKKRFLRQNFQLLLEAGINLRTLEEKDGWDYLLAHGECFYTSWDIDRLDDEQLRALEQLVSDYVEAFSADQILLSEIRKRTG